MAEGITCRERIELARSLKERIFAGEKVEADEIANSHVEEAVIESWMRVRETGITPDEADQRVEIPPEELAAIQEEHVRLLEVAESALPMFIQRDTSPFTSMALLDGRGHLLYALARGPVLVSYLAESGIATHAMDSMGANSDLVFYGGLEYGEETMGTTGWSVCLKTRHPVQLVNTEQYATGQTRYNQLITAIPILDATGAVDCIIAFCHFLRPALLDTPYEACARADLEFLAMAASVLEARTRLFNPDLPTMAARSTIREHALVLADADGRIIKVNARAREMLGLPKGSKRFGTIEEVLPVPNAFCASIRHGGRYETRATVDEGGRAHEITVSAEAFTVAASVEGCSIVVRLFDDSSWNYPVNAQKPPRSRAFDGILGESRAIEHARDLCRQFALSDENVLLMGESGTGKELFARSIHAASRPDGPFVTFDASAIPPDLVLPSLFGYEPETLSPGQKTGRPGLIERASHGTLFLDEIADIPLQVQASLLRVLETRRIARIGGIDERTIDFRVIATTSSDPESLMRRGRLRRDFFHRISVLETTIPPLRDRVVDIWPLAQHHLEAYCERARMPLPNLEGSFREKLESYEWPGNVRQLENAITYAINVATAQGISALSARQLPERVLGRTGSPLDEAESPGIDDTESFNLAKLERQTILRAWRKTDGDTARMSAMLGISISTLNRRLKQYGLRK